MRMNAMVCKNLSKPKGMSRYWFTNQVTKVAKVNTKMTAAPIPKAVEVFFEVPKKGQMPKNWEKITLLTKTVDRIIIRYFMV
jgi:hypothetical protein